MTDSPRVTTEVAPGVHCLGPRGRTQTNVYLVRSGAAWVLVDAGWANDAPSIRAAADALFGSGAGPAAILLTHAHPDHDGAALELARAWGCPVLVHPAELAIASGDFAAMAEFAGPMDRWVILPMMRAMGRRRREAMLARSSLAEVVGAIDSAGGVSCLPDWKAIHTPGHTPGHVSMFRPGDRVLLTGDALVTLRVNSVAGLVAGSAGLSGPPRYTSWSWPAAVASVAALARLEPAVVAGGHGMPMTGPGTADALRAFADRLSGRASP